MWNAEYKIKDLQLYIKYMYWNMVTISNLNKCLNESIFTMISVLIHVMKKRQMGSVVNLPVINLGCFSFQPGGFDILYLLHLFCASCVSGVSKEVLYVSETFVYFFLWYAKSWPPILMCAMNPISWTIDQAL